MLHPSSAEGSWNSDYRLHGISTIDHSLFAHESLRSCSKQFMSISDRLRTSIRFTAEEQCSVECYMQKLPHLNSLTIEYNTKTDNIRRSLASLHKVSPKLKALFINCKEVASFEASSPCRIALKSSVSESLSGTNTLANHLHPWRRYLKRLELINTESRSSTSHTCSVMLGCLSQLVCLEVLKVQSSELFQTANIAGCLSLLQLTLIGQHRRNRIHGLSLDVTSCTFLQELSCKHCSLEHLKVRGLKVLQHVNLSGNAVSELDLSTCTALASLNCSGNRLQALDMTSCPKLQTLHCCGNPLSQLILSGCTLLSTLTCGSINLNLCELDLSSCTALRSLQCGEVAGLINMDLRNCLHLEELCVESTSDVHSINMAGLEELRRVKLDGVDTAVVDLTGCTALQLLVCRECPKLTTLCLLGCSELHSLMVQRCGLRDIDLISCKHLGHLDCRETPLEALVLTSCVELGTILCSESLFKTLDVSPSAPTLEFLYCDGSPSLEVLRATGCSMLKVLDCRDCPQLRELNCDGCLSLTQLSCEGCGKFSDQSEALLLAAKGPFSRERW